MLTDQQIADAIEEIAVLIRDRDKSEIDRLTKQRDRLVEAIPSPDKLDLLADWFDLDDVNKGRAQSNSDVQRDLREWAKTARTALAAVKEMEGEKTP